MSRYYNLSIRNLAYRLRKFKDVLHQELAEEIKSNEPIITEMVRMQLHAGTDGYTSSIQPPYTARTIKNKIKKGQPVDRVTLRDTGDFYKSLRVEFDEDGFYITSTDEDLMNLLKEKYGSPILRLSDSNMSILLHEFIRPSLKEKLKEYLQNG